LKESENRYRILVENLPQKVFLKDKNSVYISCNENYAKDLKIKPEEIVGRTDFEFYPKELAEKYRGDDKRIMKLAKTEDIEERYTQGDKEFWVHTAKTPIRDEKGNVTGVLGIFWDITERKKAEEYMLHQSEMLEKTVKERTAELNMQIEKAEKLANVKDEFIRNITHELKTPLSVIMGNIQLIRDTRARGNDKEFEELVGMMDRNAVRLRSSIEEVLELSRIGALTEYRKERMDLRKLVDDVAAVYRPIAEKGGITLEVNVPPLSVIGDPATLPYALSNLVSNAVKFTDKGKVTISAESTDGFVTISVSDTGKGISEENQKRLFEKFFKADPTAPGTGVGLAMVKEIVEGHGGRIKFKSKLGQGTTFTITLPKSGVGK
jgi:PAS domain S-box-containing protein